MDVVFNQIHFLFNTFYGCMGIIISVLSFSIFQEFEKDENKAEISFQLNPQKTINEFWAILVMNVLMMTGFIFYIIWGMIEFNVSLNIAMSLGLFFMFSISFIMSRWWRRFR